MAYEKQAWQTGDIVTAAKLNHMEDGIASSIMMVPTTIVEGESELTITLGKTWQEIYDAMSAGKCVLISAEETQSEEEFSISYLLPLTAGYDGTMYCVLLFPFWDAGRRPIRSFKCDSTDGHPACSIPQEEGQE